MNRTYRILSIPGFVNNWEAVPAASIDVRPWEKGGPIPPAEARVVYTGSGFAVQLKAWEKNLRVVTHESNGMVWEDSCIEFFANFAPERGSRYINFEVNAEGVMLIGFGSARETCKFQAFDASIFDMKADVPPYGAAVWSKPFYTMSFVIPVSFLEGLYGKLDIKPGYRFTGNFQKCGDKTANPHYGCWNPIVTEIPDFHRPECFGEMIIS